MVDTTLEPQSVRLVVGQVAVIIADPERLRQHVPVLRAVYVDDLVEPHPARADLAETVEGGEAPLAVYLVRQATAKEVIIVTLLKIVRFLAQQERTGTIGSGTTYVQVHGLRIIKIG